MSNILYFLHIGLLVLTGQLLVVHCLEHLLCAALCHDTLPLCAYLAVLNLRDALLDGLGEKLPLLALRHLKAFLDHVVAVGVLDEVGQAFTHDQVRDVLGSHLVGRKFKALLKHV